MRTEYTLPAEAEHVEYVGAATEELEVEYEAAFQEWEVADDAELWDQTTGDGIA